MITGHGFNFVGSGFWHGYLPAQAPHSILFETWTDLGLIGALAGAALTYLAYDLAANQSARLAPFCLGRPDLCHRHGRVRRRHGPALVDHGPGPGAGRFRLGGARRFQDRAPYRADPDRLNNSVFAMSRGLFKASLP